MAAVHAHIYGGAELDRAELVGESGVFEAVERAASAPGAFVDDGHVVYAEHNVQGRGDDGLAGAWGEHVERAQHHLAGFHYRLTRQWNVDGHLVAVEVGVEGGADQRVKLNGPAVYEDRLEGLNTEAVEASGHG